MGKDWRESPLWPRVTRHAGALIPRRRKGSDGAGACGGAGGRGCATGRVGFGRCVSDMKRDSAGARKADVSWGTGHG
eukprot:14533858-Alexandrium_andersonii.AAC.1